MLQEWKAMEKPEEEEIRVRLAAAKEKLAKQQLLIKEQKIPVLVLMEGWGTAGKGSVIGQVIQNIDPRFFKVESMGEKSEEERRKPFLYRYFKRIPEEGKFVSFSCSKCSIRFACSFSEICRKNFMTR